MSLMQMDQVVKDVEPRLVTVQGAQQTVYDVTDAAGVKWTAWERDLAEQAFNLKGQPSIWKVEEKPNPRNANYPYRNLKGIIAKMSGNMESALGGGLPSTPQASALPSTPSASSRDEEIHRQTAAKCVSWMAASTGMTPQEFWSNIEDLTRFFNTGKTPDGTTFVPQAAQQQQSFDSFPEHVPPDDDIPF